jgi:hypothetical protein
MTSPNCSLKGANASNQSTDCASAQNGADWAIPATVNVTELTTTNAMLETIETKPTRICETPASRRCVS